MRKRINETISLLKILIDAVQKIIPLSEEISIILPDFDINDKLNEVLMEAINKKLSLENKKSLN